MNPTVSHRSFLAGAGSLLRRFAADERGATVIEYGLLVALISAAIAGTLLAIGDEMNADFTIISGALRRSE